MTTKRKRFEQELKKETQGMVKHSLEWQEQVNYLLRKYRKK